MDEQDSSSSNLESLFNCSFDFFYCYCILFWNLGSILLALSFPENAFFNKALLSWSKLSLFPAPFKSSKFSYPIILANISIQLLIFSKSVSLQKTTSS